MATLFCSGDAKMLQSQLLSCTLCQCMLLCSQIRKHEMVVLMHSAVAHVRMLVHMGSRSDADDMI